MLRADALQAIYSEVEDQIVVTIMGAVAAELYTLGHRSNFFYLEHAMGLASSMGLGIALAMPRHKVVVIDGDGSLLVRGMPADMVGDIAFEQGIRLHELTMLRASLEEAYMEVTADSVEYHAEARTGAAPIGSGV